MKLKRIGKIAQLPWAVRQELNHRLQQGQPGKQLVTWLNSLAEVKEVLAEEFDGRAISEQNLSDWKQGGYPDWLRHEESRQRLERLEEQGDSLNGSWGELAETSDRLSTLLAAELAAAIEALMAEPLAPVERWKRLREILRDLSQLRREDHRAAWLRIGQERWEHDLEQLEWEKEKRMEKELRRIRKAPRKNLDRVEMLAALYGGGEKGRKTAARIVEFEQGLREGSLTGEARSKPAREEENQGGSNWIKPDPTEGSEIEPDQG